MSRPAISVIVPFKGDWEDARRVLDQLTSLEVGANDELLVVDNSPDTVVDDEPPVRVIRAQRLASSYYARNIGADTARNPWLLFIDSDCLVPPTLLDDYFPDEPSEETGILAGELVAAPGQTAFAARYERARGHLEVTQHMEMGPGPSGITANLLVRRSTWQDLGGFHEVRSGADLEFCWRAQEAGWTVEHQPQARVEHLHTEDLGALLRKARRYGPGQAWVDRRFPGASPPPRLTRQLVRAAGGSAVWLVSGRFLRAAYKIMDGLWSIAYAIGYRLGDNRPHALSIERATPDDRMGVASTYPDASASGSRLPGPRRVVALHRPIRVARDALQSTRVDYLEDTTAPERIVASIRFGFRHPIRLAKEVRRASGTGKSVIAITPAALAIIEARPRRLVCLDVESGELHDRLVDLTGCGGSED